MEFVCALLHSLRARGLPKPLDKAIVRFFLSASVNYCDDENHQLDFPRRWQAGCIVCVITAATAQSLMCDEYNDTDQLIIRKTRRVRL